MAEIVFADDGLVFDGTSPGKGPLGGAESAVVAVCEALAARGHDVTAYTRCTEPVAHNGVAWRPIAGGLPTRADLYVANRSHHLIDAMPGARATAFWTHNPCGYMLKWRYLWRLWKVKPTIVFVGDYHARTYPAWAPGGERVVIPLGLSEEFLAAVPADRPPPPRAIFTSNPLRGLDWLLDVWESDIRPQVPGGELHLFCGPAVYGAVGTNKAGQMNAILGRARRMKHVGVVLREPVAKTRLAEELAASRVLLYRGDLNETFCLAVAEAQAMGVPAVVQPEGSMRERVVDGVTGVVAADDAAFAENAVALLRDDELWTRMHNSALDLQRRWRWDDVAQSFERLLPET